MQWIIDGFNHTWQLSLEAAPWLLLGLLAAGFMKVLVPAQAMARWMGRPGARGIVRAALVGAPLPLCSCGVLPAAVGMRRQGASTGSTVSFLVATPETGVDSLAVSYVLLGPFMTVVRPIAALLSAVVAGLVTDRLPSRHATTQPTPGACCGNVDKEKLSWAGRLLEAVRYALADLLDDLKRWLLVGLVLAGLVSAWVPPEALASWGSGPLAMLVMALAGLPMYICATASTAVAAAMGLAGVSPGTVLVFLLAGPATNIATLAVVRREMGLPVMVGYVTSIVTVAIGLGLVTDMLADRWSIRLANEMGAPLFDTGIVGQGIAGIALAVLVIASVPRLRRPILGR